MKHDGEIKAVVYTEEVNDLFRGLKEDLDRYFDVLDSGFIMPRYEGKVTYTDLTFGHCFISWLLVIGVKNLLRLFFINDRRFNH